MKELTLLHVAGSGATAIGYGRLGVKLAQALVDKGIDLYDDIAMPSNADPNYLARQVDGRRHKKTNVACWVSTPGHARGWWKGQYTGLFSMWEASLLPEAYREHLYAFDVVIVPSHHNLELFGNHHPNVHLATLGVDPDEWHYVPRTPPNRDFRFLVAGSGPRKGTDLAVKAFRRVFKTWPKDQPRPVLVMKNPKGEDFYGDRIEMVTGRITDQDERDLYATAHCALAPSRGEGFGLQPLQAMAQGIPTILTNAHGHSSFAHLGYGLSTTMQKASYFIYGDAGDWWEPNFDELCEWMEHVYNHYDHCVEEAKVSAQIVARDFTWQRTAEQFLAAFGDELGKPYVGDGTWFTPDQKLYRLMVNRPWKADIAGTTYIFTPGVLYYEIADVKRILFEAGILDPACLESEGQIDEGLTPGQAEAIGAYRAAHSYCEHCGQRLGSQPTKADDLLEAMHA